MQKLMIGAATFLAVCLIYAVAVCRKELPAAQQTQSEFVRVVDKQGSMWTVSRWDIRSVEPGFMTTNILVRLRNPERCIVVDGQTGLSVDALLK